MADSALNRFLKWWITPLDQKPKETKDQDPPAVRHWVGRIKGVLDSGYTRTLVEEIDKEFQGMTSEARKTLIHEVIRRFAYYVADLGASEQHHHSKEFGLFEHTLEVALWASRAMSDVKEERGEKGEAVAEERFRRKYACFLLGLLHDMGKCVDVSIQSEDGSEEWNAFIEGLCNFHIRHSFQGKSIDRLQYVSGRGLRAHQWRGMPLWRLILPDAPFRFLGKQFLAFLVDASVEECFKESSPEVPQLAHQIVEAVCEADKKSTKADLARQERALPKATCEDEVETETEAESEVVPLPKELPKREEHPIFVERIIDNDTPTRAELIYSFKKALLYVLRKGQVPLNRPGGVFVGSRYIFISWDEAAYRIYESMKAGGCILSWVPGDLDQIFENALGYEGWLVSEDSDLCEDLVIEGVTPRGEKERCAILKREVLEMDAPVFSGAITVYQAEDYECLSVDERMKRAEGGDPGMRYGGARRNAEERERKRVNLNPSLPNRGTPRRREEAMASPGPVLAPPVGSESDRAAPDEECGETEEQTEAPAPAPPSPEGEGADKTTANSEGKILFDGEPLVNDLVSMHRNLKEQQVVVRGRMKALVEEFKRRIKRSRLILFPKCRVKGAPISSLYWGILMKSKNGSEQSTRWIKHVSTPLNDTLIYKVARKHKFKDIFYDFDRRRTALNTSLHGVGEALTKIECSLVRRGKAPGQSAASLDKGSEAIEVCIRGLVDELVYIGKELEDLSSWSKEAPFASRLYLAEPEAGDDGRPGDGRWHLSNGTLIESKINRGSLEILGLGRKEREDVMNYEVERRKLRDLNAKAWGVVTRVRKAYHEAWPASRDALKEGERVGVDRYGKSLEDGDEGLGGSGDRMDEVA